ncbi:MAG: 50S ribosomal protein L32e [Candidatus Woesearchaeota archaeon]|nr:50S ribosomal protein L32e [Candidatus Woesearchaeota archaeon]
MSKLLELRKAIKAKKPIFLRQDYHKKKELGRKWRKPKGIHSKMRHHFKGKIRCVAHGWGSPLEVKYLHPSGLKQIFVHTVDDLKKINAKTEGAMIAATVGMKKKFEILKKAMELGIKVLNIKNVESYLKEQEDKFKERKKKHIEQKETKKEEKKSEKLEEKITPELSDDERKKQEKLEKEKVLTKKGAM